MFKERDEIKAKLDRTELNLKRKIIATHKLKLKKVILEIENAQNKLEKLENEFKNTIRYIKTLKRKISELCQIYGHEWHFENIATREFHWHFDGFDCQYKCMFCGKEENIIVNDLSTIKDYHNPSEVLSKKALDFQLEDYINIYTKALKK